LKYFALILVIILNISCSKSKEQTIQESIKTEFKKEMENASSFKISNIKINSTITVGERKKVMNAQRLKELIELRTKFIEIGMATDDITSSEIQLKKEMEFLKDKDEDHIAVYYVDFVVLRSNKTGAKIKNEYSATVLNDEKLTVVHLKSMNEYD
jgi:hypothetical protein